MAPGLLQTIGSDELTNGITNGEFQSGGFSLSRTRFPHDDVHFDPSLKPKNYQVKGTSTDSKILFQDVRILDSTGREPYQGDVFIQGERIRYVGTVPNGSSLASDPSVRVIAGRGRTLMSGLGDAHTHFTWNNGDLGRLGELGVEEHTLLTARSAQTYLDSGYTMCFGAASAKTRLDCVVRDAINAGELPGPRYLANGKEMAVPDGELVAGITAFAKGPLEMRETIRHHIAVGVDQIKLSMSGEEITETRSAQDCYFSDEETAACVDEAHRQGVRLCAHARARDSVKMCVRHGVDVIYHASWIDEEGMDMLEKAKEKHIVAPGINWLIATLYDAEPFGYSFSKAEQVGYKKELDAAIKGLREMHRRGISVLPGGDYGFAWTPHGTYARDLEHFVKLLNFTPMESVVAATAGVAKLFMREDELGKILPGYFADCILVDGDPLEDISVLQDHARLNAIIINGRIHKLSPQELLRAHPQPVMAKTEPALMNFVAYELTDGTKRTRVGHLDYASNRITPLAYASGTPLSDLYQVFAIDHKSVVSAGEPFARDNVKLLAPIRGRDVLAVGKNYSEHAKEFNASGYDASDNIDIPSHPVIFTKRSTSIIAHEEEILPHANFTSTLDYEGEIGVIIGKSGTDIGEAEADDYVWGYTIINDVTAREKQKDHKQFYIGKSADTFCPMGPIAVPKASLPKTLKIETRVNGELRQEGTTEELIFSVPRLIKTLSESQTLQPGDVIATGTPAGVGFGLNPPKFLQPGDVVEITVSGLGTLRNRIASQSAENQVTKAVAQMSPAPIYNISITNGGLGLTKVGKKLLNVRTLGAGEPVVFVHGLGGTTSYFEPLIATAGLSGKKCILYDLEGHGLSPTQATSVITVQSMVDDLFGLFTHPDFHVESAVLIAHSMGCLVAETFTIQYPHLVKRLVLIGPPPSPLPQVASEGCVKRASAVRAGGMSAVVSTVVAGGTSEKTRASNALAAAAVQQSLLAQDPEGYAKGCTALAGSAHDTIEIEKIRCPTLIVTGDEDKISPASHVQTLAGKVMDCKLAILPDVGHWHAFEDANGLGSAVKSFL
ncbi:MAG: hypothetical protein M1822_001467 [Bathelium mastoideum]|nr:MAG: hypothetical protein M1822_001467 [Bathelium mastoideum]